MAKTDMALFAGKTKALLLEQPTTNGKIELGDVQLESVSQFINEGAYISLYGSALSVAEVSQGSITINKNVAGVIEDKVGLGQGTVKNGKLDQVTVYMNAPKKITEGLTAADLTSGFEASVAVKSEKHADMIRKFREREAFKSMALLGADADAVSIGAAIPTDEKTAEAAYLKIVAAASETMKLVDPEQAIDTISPDMIFIDLDPTLFSTLVRLGFASGEGKQMFEKGMFTIANLGGFTVRMNPLLTGAVTKTDGTQVLGFISTKFAGLAPIRMVAMNAGRFDGSNDKVVYSEAKFGSDNAGALKAFTPVYDKVIKAIIAK